MGLDLGYMCINLRYGSEGAHKLYHHLDKGFENIYDAICSHWINHCLENISNNRPWYYRIPYTWWWGTSLIDFIFEICNHVAEEDEWIKRLMK